jgi:transcriptional regulator with XRE-family HTH domain
VRQRGSNLIDVMVAGHIAAQRQEAGHSIASFCRLIGVDELKYRRFESARQRIDPRSLQQISLALGVSPVMFFTPRPFAVAEGAGAHADDLNAPRVTPGRRAARSGSAP